MKNILEEFGIKLLSSGLECYDNLLINGIPAGVISVDCGATTTFKSLLNLQKSFSIMKETGGNVIYLDTEGGMIIAISGWKPRFEKRFNLERVNIVRVRYESPNWKLSKELEPKHNLILLTIRDIFKLFSIHGTPMTFRIGKKGKIDIIRKPFSYKEGEKEKVISEELPIEETPIGKLCTAVKPNAIIYDSLIELFKQRIPGSRENFGARAYLLHNLMGCMQRLAEVYNMPVMGITHTSRDPADPMKIREVPSALSTISYNAKIMTLIQNPFFQNPMSIQILEKINRRRITIWRHPFKEPLSEHCDIQLTSRGFIEVGENKKIEEKIEKKEKEVVK